MLQHCCCVLTSNRLHSVGQLGVDCEKSQRRKIALIFIRAFEYAERGQSYQSPVSARPTRNKYTHTLHTDTCSAYTHCLCVTLAACLSSAIYYFLCLYVVYVLTCLHLKYIYLWSRSVIFIWPSTSWLSYFHS